jgi:hypothetical protein
MKAFAKVAYFYMSTCFTEGREGRAKKKKRSRKRVKTVPVRGLWGALGEV